MAAGEMNHLAVVMGGDGDTAPKTSSSGGGVWFSKMPTKENVANFFKGIKSGRNKQAAPPREDAPGGSDEECWKEKPIIAMMKEQELGKSMFVLALPMITGLMFLKSGTLSPAAVHFSLVAIAVGSAAIWNGLLLRKTWPRIAGAVEQVGVVLVFLGFHMLVWNFLPPELRLVPAVCLFFSVLPFFMAATPGGSTGEDGVKEEDVACTI